LLRPPPREPKANFGRIPLQALHRYRDEIVISTKAGYDLWPGPYGEWGSRKYMPASFTQSLKRLGVNYVDIFYSHRFDPNTPLEETMGALRRLGILQRFERLTAIDAVPPNLGAVLMWATNLDAVGHCSPAGY